MYTATLSDLKAESTMLNPDIDTRALAKQYAKDNRLRLDDLFLPDIAERLRTTCRDHVSYEYLCHIDGKNFSIPAARLRELETTQIKELNDKIVAAAANGIGFFYGGYQMQKSMPAPDNEQLVILHQVFEFLNSAEMFSLISAITGLKDLKYAAAQYTSYTSGQFLTRHKDDIAREGRRVAYVIGLSKKWHPDWGGLLHFFEEDGTPRDFWMPSFNTLSLFDVQHVHSVSYVTPFAKEPRLSLTGWFCV